MSDTSGSGTEHEEWDQDPDREGSEFGAGPLYGCPNCFVLVWIEPSGEDEVCPACGFPGEFDELHLIPASQTSDSEVYGDV